ncbi:MAG: hypothetical protein CTY37_00380 [Methylotenera sp.]|nr:MAG: hypothetical protein CTY37_00380 [Methylotenera sp.]
MTDTYSGFIASFEPARSKKLFSSLKLGGGFSDSFSIDDWELNKKEIFILVLERSPLKVSGAAFVERSYGNGGTGKPKFSFTDLLSFGEPIPITDFAEDIENLGSWISNSTNGGRRLDQDNWDKLINAIKKFRPNISLELDKLLKLIFKDVDLVDVSSNRATRLAEQRDAIGIAVDIAGGNRPLLMKSINTEKADDANSILDLIDAIPLDERSHVEEDAAIIRKMLGANLDEVDSKVVSIEKDRQVRVHVTDKTKLETVLGTDLLIYQSLFNSFILIQYKLMDFISKGAVKGWSFKPDSQFDQQVKTIKNIRNNCLVATTNQTEWDFRLHNEPYFFKFCERRNNSSREDSLVKGINISFEHLEKYLEFNKQTTDLRLGYQNCSRYFNNSEFISLARSGWIGSSDKASDCIAIILEENRKAGRKTVLAIVDVVESSTAELRKIKK